MRAVRILLLSALAVAALAACTPQSAHQARDDLVTTSAAAASASKDALTEREKLGAVAKDIQFDIRNIKEVEAFFDREDRVVTFE